MKRMQRQPVIPIIPKGPINAGVASQMRLPPVINPVISKGKNSKIKNLENSKIYNNNNREKKGKWEGRKDSLL